MNYKQLFRSNLSILLLAIAIALCNAKRISYSGYSLYRITPNTQYQVNKLIELMNERREGLEFWTEPNYVNGTVDIMASPEEDWELRETLRHVRAPTKKIMHDIEEVINRTNKPALSLPKTMRTIQLNETTIATTRGLRETLEPSFFYTRYSRYSMIEAKLQDVSGDPRVSKEVIGTSSEGRNLYLVKVSSDPSANKPVIFLDAGHHARESLIKDDMPVRSKSPRTGSVSSSSNIDSSIAQNEIQDDSLKAYRNLLKLQLDKYDFWFIPVVNPDGYEYSHVSDRLWRKTRSRLSSICIGADPNRNYPFHWSESGSSSFSCSEIYTGVSAASEPEVAAVVKTLTQNKDRIVMYVSLHAYSQLLLVPYGHDRVYPENYSDLERVGRAAIEAVKKSRGKQYRFGVSSILLYPAAGGSDDFAYGACGIKYAFTWELPDTGNHGFILPESEIIPTAQETVLGLNAMIQNMK